MREIMSNLHKNGFETIEVQNAAQALEVAKSFVKPNISVGLGGSTTVSQIGLLEWLIKNREIELFNQYEQGIDMEENFQRRRKGLLSDLYITSSNAVTIEGELVNVDGDGNRVAAQIFGPKKVLLIVSKNKIVKSIDEGFKRIKNRVIPKNVKRMNDKLLSMGKEPHYNADNIANKYAVINGDKPGRTTIIFVDEELGF